MRKSIALVVVCIMALGIGAFAGLGSDKTAYIGGTENQIKDGTEGESSAKDDKVFLFMYKGGKIEIRYEQVNDLEYGQKGRAQTWPCSDGKSVALLSHKRKHFLTIGWKDAQDKQHAVVLELGKSIVRTTIVTIEARTGKKVEYEDDEARKSGMGGGI